MPGQSVQSALIAVLRRASDSAVIFPTALELLSALVHAEAGLFWSSDDDSSAGVDCWGAPEVCEQLATTKRLRPTRTEELCSGDSTLFLACNQLDFGKEQLVHHGFASALYVPVRSGSRTHGFCELLRRSAEPPDEQSLSDLCVCAFLLAQFIDREELSALARLSSQRERRVRAESIREQERFHALLVQAPFAIVIERGPELVIDFVNPAALRLLGARSVLGRPQREAFPEVPEHIKAAPEAVYATGEPAVVRDFRVPLLNERGRVEDRFFDVSMSPLRDAADVVDAVFTVAIDVTERIRARRIQLIADSVPHMVWMSSPHGQVEFYNRRWRDYAGITVRQPLPEHWRKVIHPDDIEGIEDRWLRCLKTGDPFECELRIRRVSDGAYRWHLVRAVPNRDENGEITNWVGSATDIDAQKRAEHVSEFLLRVSAALGASLDRDSMLRDLAELVVFYLCDYCAIYLLDHEDSPPRLLLVTHRDPERARVAEQQWREHPPELSGSGSIAEVVRTGQPVVLTDMSDQSFEASARDPEHLALLRRLQVRSLMTLPVKSRRRTLGVLTFVSSDTRCYDQRDLDVAQEVAVRAGQAMDNAQLYAESQLAVRARDDFLSIASHELRTPLTPLKLNIQALHMAADGRLPQIPMERWPSKLEVVARQVTRLETLVHNLLEISRIAGGRLLLERERGVDLVAVVREVIEKMTPEAARSATKLVLNVPSSVLGEWDRMRIDQIVTNLTSNALKFGRGKTVTIDVTADETTAGLTVRDQGIGIAPEDRARIFERFERAVASRHYGGFGLGLWIVNQIVEAFGGKIYVESELGQGACFRVQLPRSAAAQTPADQKRVRDREPA